MLGIIEGPPATISRFLPGNYKVTHVLEQDGTIYCYIEGEDHAGWTFYDYVKPRLESGLYFGLEEIAAIDPDAREYDG